METPASLGLPVRFDSWRVGQDDAVIAAAVSLQDKRFYVSSQPTGAGKSIWYMSLAWLLGAKRVLIVTVNKALQTQLLTDFGSMGLVQIKGQGNYRCRAVMRSLPPGIPGHAAGDPGELFGSAPENTPCSEGPCHAGLECGLKERGCEYYDAARVAREARFVVTNYDYHMNILKYGEAPIGAFDLMVLDEAHEAPEKLAEFCSIHVSKVELDELLGVSLPPLSAGTEYWATWAKGLAFRLKLDLDGEREAHGSVKHIRRIRDLLSKMEDLSKAGAWRRGDPSNPAVTMPGMSTDWVAEESDDGATFSPVWAHGYAEDYLFAGCKQVVLTSATIVPKTLDYLGIRATDYTFNERPSTFPVHRRPIYFWDGIRISRDSTHGEKLRWINRIDAILDARLDKKAIVHCVSYELAKFIKQHSRHARWMISHSKHDTFLKVAQFRSREAPCILVSPSVREGWDFPYDQCEVQIVAKAPFVNIGAAVIKARRRLDKSYLDYLCILALVQSCGRGMRSPDDICETFIIDGNMGWLYARNKLMFPKYFRDAFSRIDSLPEPLSRARRKTGPA